MKLINITSANIKNSSNTKGFTLIELIIVIGVLGVLAAALLIAIDPVEQLNRGRDAGRLSSVTQLGRAMQAYVAGQNTGIYPAPVDATHWQSLLTGSGDIKNVITPNPAPTTDCSQAAGAGYAIDNHFCYLQVGAANPNDAIIWTTAESKSAKAKANSCATYVAAVYVMSLGRAGYECLALSSTTPSTVAANLY